MHDLTPVRDARRAISLVFAAALILIFFGAQSVVLGVPALYGQGRAFSSSDHIVSTTVFHWFTSTGGQKDGPWLPIEGRPSWTGTTSWWKTQIKQMMMANIDALWVHLIPSMETQRTNLFRALNELRSAGYDTPKIAPFLDPMITWDGQPMVDVATASGKDTFVNQYIRFFEQYYSVNQDAYADSYLELINGRVVLDTWHVKFNLANLSSLTRSDVENRLKAAFGASHPVFNTGIRMVTTALNPPTLSFVDEKVPQFEVHAYYQPATQGSTTAVQLKGGYWDQNIRTPGYCLPRNGGVNYTNAWNSVNRNTVKRVYIESWNEYDEGSGIYAANPVPYIIPPNPSFDVWSSTNDPWEYIKTTASKASAFNDTPDLNAIVLWNSIPAVMRPGSTRTAQVVVRNEGDRSWRGADNIKLGQNELMDPVLFGASRYPVNDTQDEISTYGGIFRGRPITFSVTLVAPSTPGAYTTHWQMLQESVTWFGQILEAPITVTPPIATPPAPTDAGAYTTDTSLTFNWQAVTDPYFSIVGYNCQIGTTPGGADVYSAYVGNVLGKTRTGTKGKTYFCRVQAVDSTGWTSPWSGSSDGIAVVDHAGLSISAAKQLPSLASVGLSAKTVSAVFGDCFYVAESDRSSGIRVVSSVMPSGLVLGQLADVGGVLTIGPNGERYISGAVSVR